MLALAVGLLLAPLSATKGSPSGSALQLEQLVALTPGAREFLVETLPVNVVFVG